MSKTKALSLANFAYILPYKPEEPTDSTHKVVDLNTNVVKELYSKPVEIKVINNYLFVWEASYKNFKIMKNDGTQIKSIPGLKEGIKAEITPIGDRLFFSQDGLSSMVELKISDFMPDYIYFNQRGNGGK